MPRLLYAGDSTQGLEQVRKAVSHTSDLSLFLKIAFFSLLFLGKKANANQTEGTARLLGIKTGTQ